MLRTVRAARYVLPFREGGSVPALFEADDLGMYVVKLRGAAQGPKALVAELVAGELGRALGLDVPELVFVDVDAAFGAAERDPEIAEPLERSAGLNLGLDYLPGSVTYDPAAKRASAAALERDVASKIVLFDAFVTNVDRTPRNPNLLWWHGKLWLIDHGAALFFHHGWTVKTALEGAAEPFSDVKHHVLLPRATRLREAGEELARRLAAVSFEAIASEIPDAWLGDGFADAAAERAAYVAWFEARRAAFGALIAEAERAQRL